MKDTIRKINLLAYPDAKALIDYCPKDPTLEDVLVALKKENYWVEVSFYYDIDVMTRIHFQDIKLNFNWQLTKTLTQQNSETQLTIKQIFEDGK